MSRRFPEPGDTDPAMEELRLAALRRLSPAAKLEQVRQLCLMTQRLALARIRRQYPDASEREQQLRLGALRIERETMIKVFGWDPQREGY